MNDRVPDILVIEDPQLKYLSPLRGLPPGVTFHVSDQHDELCDLAPQVEVILAGFADAALLPAVFRAARQLRWVHSLRAGVEKVLFPELAASDVVLTNARGVYARQLADFVMTVVGFFAKGVRRMIASQQAGKWEPFDVDDICGATMGIVGYGGIGHACAERARAFGMRVVALRRRPELSRGDASIDEIFGPEQLHALLARSDYVVLAAPNTTATRGMIGRAELAAMNRDAVLINIGRGSLVDETALAEVLSRGDIRGAALDVFDVEPLPPGHVFYGLENLLLSPHCSDRVPRSRENAVEAFVESYTRYRLGKPLDSVVDKQAGY